ncbi:hypothetical protein J22TS1_48100 [Siminovitchia terrae]|uniref:helix-turn-helix domain-containing protein n=1 Tax=Siminovitchia terrae TaxID=1914933 RepID=UPI001B060F3F|nr:hypothetical protein J22TS1_48100 [Siminovitchia terrae]
MGQEKLTLTRKELKRVAVIDRLIQKTMTTREAADLLGGSIRQVYRLKDRILKEGVSTHKGTYGVFAASATPN